VKDLKASAGFTLQGGFDPNKSIDWFRRAAGGSSSSARSMPFELSFWYVFLEANIMIV